MELIQDTLTSKVELRISCRHLKDRDLCSKSDPMAVLFHKLNNSFFEFGRTEVIKNNLNPTFAKVFEIDYHFEERQLFKVEIYDSDSSSHKLEAHDFLGRFEFSLGEVVSRKIMEAKLNNCINSKAKQETVILNCQEASNSKESLILQLNGVKLDKKDLFGKSDPYFEAYRSNDSIKFSKEDPNINNYNNFSLVYRSKPVMNTLNPSWPSFCIKLNHLCFGDKDRLIKIGCSDWNCDGSSDFIGQCLTSVNNIISVQGQVEALELINSKKLSKKKGYKNSGTITVHKALLRQDHSFIDYISRGTELNFTVAIDFTASNGKQHDPRSLHFIPQGGFPAMANQYETAISALGLILQDYDSDKLFPALGFGARIPPRGDISHCFPINFCLENPFCAGVDGLLNTYRSVIRSITLSGPTNFSPSIRHVQRFAQQYTDGSKYFVLLIITDGVITDLDATIDAIIDCSFLPMSVIIIGVGNDDFSTMDVLDCDNGLLRHGQKVADRDIVQFVPIRNFITGQSRIIDQAALCKAVLFELPKQVTGWMRKHQIAPLLANQNPLDHGMPVNTPQAPPTYPKEILPPPYPMMPR